MRYDDPSEPLRMKIDTHQCNLSPDTVARMQTDVDALTRMVEHFPKPELRVLVEHNNRSNDFSVKTTLLLPGATLVASDHNQVMHAAYEQCINNLMREVKDYKDRLGHVAERQKQFKGTHRDLEPTLDPDAGAIDSALAGGDYPAFRAAMQGYEEPLRDRVGRWLERSTAVDGQLGRRFTIADIVEEVFLDAFDGYEQRPKDVRFGDWLERLIDPAVKEMLRHPDQVLENVSMARSMQGVRPTREEK
jgi:ribosome-associated translation inhibitor RaiA